MKLDQSFCPTINPELSLPRPPNWLGCRCRHPTAHIHTHICIDSIEYQGTHTHPHTPAHRHTLIGRNKISDLSARVGWLGVKGPVRLFVSLSLRVEQRHDKTWSSSTRPSIVICAMHAARTYLEYYDVGSYHAVDTSLMYGTDAVPFYKERGTSKHSAATKSTAGVSLTLVALLY